MGALCSATHCGPAAASDPTLLSKAIFLWWEGHCPLLREASSTDEDRPDDGDGELVGESQPGEYREVAAGGFSGGFLQVNPEA